MTKLYLNYCADSATVSVNNYRNNGFFNDDVVGLVEDIIHGVDSYCVLEGALEAVRDGSVWVGTNATPEILEMIEAAICEFEKNEP